MKEISRRNFLKGTLATAAGAVLAAGIGGTAYADTESKASVEDPWAGFRAADWADKVTDRVETDIVIVGGGASGLVASLEAAQQGKKVLVLESQETLGGNGALSDCMFTFGSPEQKAAAEKYGVTIEPRDILRSEVEMFDYQVPPILWLDVINHSADNTAWLQAAGAKFAPEVDYYGSLGKSPTAFMWAGGVGSGGPNFTQPVSETCKAAGVEFMTSTRARALKTDTDGKVTGVYAETADGVIEVTAKATILAGGGWAANAEMDAQYGGFNMERDVALTWAKGCQGDSLKMAAAIGARQDAISRGYMLMGAVNGVAGAKLFSQCYALWVNEDGDRFTNEDVINLCNDYQTNANRGQKQTYIILGNEMVDKAEETIAGLRESIEKAIGSEKPTFKADTVEELAEAMGVSADNLKATFARYEEHVANGSDADFGKDPQYLMSLGEGPYYALPTYQMVCLSLGGINTNRYWQVVDQVKNPIPNLYAIGADGQMVYLGFYNLNTSGGHMAVNIESGRYSVKHAVEHCF